MELDGTADSFEDGATVGMELNGTADSFENGATDGSFVGAGSVVGLALICSKGLPGRYSKLSMLDISWGMKPIPEDGVDE
jgi:hypothetical protein